MYDIVTPMTVDEAKATETDYQKRRQRERDIDAGKPVPKQRQSSMTDYQKRRAEQKRQEQLGENAWNDGTNDWTSEHDQWTKENINQDPINALTGVDEAISYESNKAYAEVGPYKRYAVYVTKKKFNDKFGFIAVAVNPRTNDAKFKANGATQQEAVEKLKSEVDKEIDVATKVSGAATIDFNVDFVRDVLEMSSNTFYAKLVPGPKLVIAGKEMEQYPDIIKQEGFKASSIRTVGDSEGATKLPAMPLSASGATTAQLVANGRYALGAETIDKDGNRIFDLEFDSVVADPRERIRMGTPAITIGTKRETKEDAQIGPDSTSPVGGHVDEARLHVGDPVIVTAPNEFEGATGEISEFSPSGKFVIVRLYNHGQHSMHLSDVEYNQYADQEDKLDEDFGNSPVASAITRRILMQRHDLLKQYGPELVGAAVDNVADYVGDVDEIGSSDVSAWVAQVERMLKENPPEAFAEEAHMYRGPHGHVDVDRKGGVTRVTRRDWDDTSKATTDVKGGKYFPNKDIKGQGTGSVASNGTSSLHSIPGGSYRKTPRLDHDANDAPNYDVDEGFQDFNKVEPYAVCLAGKPVKTFDYYEDARRFHDNWKKKLYREGDKAKADKITLMPLNLDEQEQKPGFGEFPPKQEITIVSPKKLKSGETYQDRNKYWQSQGQAPIYKTNEAGSPAQQAAIASAGKQLSVQQLATISDAALDSAYGYGRSQPGNTFGWQANLKSAAFAKQMIDKGITDVESISDAIHKGWNVTAQAFVKNPMMFDDSKTMAPEKLQAKVAQRQKLMTQQYAQLPEDEKEKDRVVARAMLQAITGQQGVAEGSTDELHADLSDKYNELAPGIEKYKDEKGADHLYKELLAIARHHGAERKFIHMCNGARNSAHMDYDTNPGHFKNWFWYLGLGNEQGVAEGDDLTHAGQDVMVWLGPPTNNPPRDDKKYWIRGKLDSTEMHNGSMRANVMTAKGMYNPELSRVFNADMSEAYTLSPAKPFRNPRGFNKQGTSVGNRFADLNRAELNQWRMGMSMAGEKEPTQSKGTPVPAKAFAQGIEKDLQKAMTKPKIQVKKNKGVAEAVNPALANLTPDEIKGIGMMIQNGYDIPTIIRIFDNKPTAEQITAIATANMQQGVAEAISKKDLLSRVSKDLNSDEFKNTPVDPNKSFTRGDHFTGPKKNDPYYTKNFGHGYPNTPSNRSHDRDVKKSLKKGVAESYWTKLQNERNTKLNSLVDELKESIKK